MTTSTSTATFNKQNEQREWQIIWVLLSLHKLSCIEWQKQRHCFTQNRMTTTKSQIKLNNQSAIVRAQYKIYNIAIFLAQVKTTKIYLTWLEIE